MSYIDQVTREMDRFERKIYRKPSMPQALARKWQGKVNNKIPEKIHQTVSESIRHMIRAALTGSSYLSDQKLVTWGSLKEREAILEERKTMYKRTAAVEGAGTGAGGILLGLADFPLLLSIKMKFLFDAAKIYGYDVNDYGERLYLLHVFQLAFSKEKSRIQCYERLLNWEEEAEKLQVGGKSYQALDWKTFQLEYRDFIDLPKTLQLIPGFGAIAGAWANYHFLDLLADNAQHAYRKRWLLNGKLQ
ncbi:EcsC family protein [Bacillus sp. H-16]|uniref:EcsC family protein n=1 Tax=Alteribacter salitolerans TaxID=2912333 RepID=UPI001962CCA3|nr:EcsC family protein [Alteribacter salitolerans]MBM7097787.1 EcsC family protein [Alteribacter salitolerans]